MLSSISSSDPVVRDQRSRSRTPLRVSLALVATVVVLLGTLELASRLLLPRLSKIEGRTAAEQRAALSLRPSSPDGRRTVLVLGNSLLEAGVEMGALQSRLSSAGIDARRLIVESTGGTDWYYGIRRLVREGARPEAMVLMLTLEQLSLPTFRGSYSARQLLLLRDVPRLARELHLGNAETSGLILSNLSAFYGLREEVRKQMTRALVAGLPQLTSLLTRPAGPPPHTRPASEVIAGATHRLAEMRREVEAVGIRFIVVVPPTLPRNAVEERAQLAAATAQSGVTVLVPTEPASLGADYYSDGFHLNQSGAALFTAAVADALKTTLATSPASR